MIHAMTPGLASRPSSNTLQMTEATAMKAIQTQNVRDLPTRMASAVTRGCWMEI